jgi:hypothetical protein
MVTVVIVTAATVVVVVAAAVVAITVGVVVAVVVSSHWSSHQGARYCAPFCGDRGRRKSAGIDAVEGRILRRLGDNPHTSVRRTCGIDSSVAYPALTIVVPLPLATGSSLNLLDFRPRQILPVVLLTMQ